MFWNEFRYDRIKMRSILDSLDTRETNEAGDEIDA
jgi:hypothetical protein